jgi:hypothetical protein
MEDIALIIPTEPKRKYGGFAGMGFAATTQMLWLEAKS